MKGRCIRVPQDTSERPRHWPTFFFLVTALSLVWCHTYDTEHGESYEGTVDAIPMDIAPREPYLETFSCTVLCHNELVVNPAKRRLSEFHTLRTVRHGPAIGWCNFCHDMGDYDQLNLIDGSRVSFDESYLICAQCHGQRFQDWERGIHGLQTGSWQDRPLRRSCTFCHDPHVPGLPRVTALPAPLQPEKRWRWP